MILNCIFGKKFSSETEDPLNMKPLGYWLIVLLFAFGVILEFPVEAGQKIIGYYTFRSATSGLKVEDIPGQLLTHVIYSFVGVSDKGKCQSAPGDVLNAQGDPTILAQFKLLKKKYPKLNLMMAVGGWGGSGKFSEIAATEIKRKTFVQSCISIIKKYALDGIDIDWEYPVTGGLPTDSKSPEDPKNFTLLLADFRKALDQISGSKKILSAAVAVGSDQLDVVGMTRYVDWLGVMAYDFYGASSIATGHHSALFESRAASPNVPKSNVKSGIESYLARGAKPEKLILGVPFYAHSWAKVSSNNHGLYQAFKGVPNTRLGEGALSYEEVQRDYLPRSTRYFDPDAKVPWLYDASNQTMVSYEDAASLKFKSDYIHKNRLGGVMIWELNHDGKHGELLKALFDALNSTFL